MMIDLLAKMFDQKALKQISEGAEEFGKTIKAILGALISINNKLDEIKALLEKLVEDQSGSDS